MHVKQFVKVVVLQVVLHLAVIHVTYHAHGVVEQIVHQHVVVVA